MRKNYIITGSIAIILLVILLLQGCNIQPANLDFSASECDDELTHATIIGTYPQENQIEAVEKHKEATGITIEPITPGVQESEWLDDNTLYVKAVILTNCAYKIGSGNYQIDSDKLILDYDLKKPLGGIQADCRCAHELIYKIKDIEKKDYQIEIEAI